MEDLRKQVGTVVEFLDPGVFEDGSLRTHLCSDVSA